MKLLWSLMVTSSLLMTGCTLEEPTPAAASPEASGLVTVRPYPTPKGTCQVIGENDLTVEYLDDAAILVGCPATATDAIAFRLAEGGMQLTQIGEWVLFSQPLR
ncbi:hypothetical protein [Yoonia sp. 2307UL14-13]|uniref:hypothetical protein n=1 Tax=Yoonia sp. 2307UL14-13 TaxID=3126506 RepID=UPI0030B17DF1